MSSANASNASTRVIIHRSPYLAAQTCGAWSGGGRLAPPPGARPAGGRRAPPRGSPGAGTSARVSGAVPYRATRRDAARNSRWTIPSCSAPPHASGALARRVRADARARGAAGSLRPLPTESDRFDFHKISTWKILVRGNHAEKSAGRSHAHPQSWTCRLGSWGWGVPPAGVPPLRPRVREFASSRVREAAEKGLPERRGSSLSDALCLLTQPTQDQQSLSKAHASSRRVEFVESPDEH